MNGLKSLSLPDRWKSRLCFLAIWFILIPMHADDSKTLTLGGGCFWCLEAVYQMVDGVSSVRSGYAGGQLKNPTYEQVCGGQTGHAEVIEITFDPAKTSTDNLLDLFWQIHDPTTLNRQGADVGTQYRSVVFYANAEQKTTAEASKLAAQKGFPSPIVTEISPLPEFYVAEDYHQNFYRTNPNHPYSRGVVKPKVIKAEALIK